MAALLVPARRSPSCALRTTAEALYQTAPRRTNSGLAMQAASRLAPAVLPDPRASWADPHTVPELGRARRYANEVTVAAVAPHRLSAAGQVARPAAPAPTM